MIIECIGNPYIFCRIIRDIEEVWRRLVLNNTKPYQVHWYCYWVEDREEMWRALANSNALHAHKWQYWYCRHIKIRKEMEEALKGAKAWSYIYNEWKKGRWTL